MFLLAERMENGRQPNILADEVGIGLGLEQLLDHRHAADGAYMREQPVDLFLVQDSEWVVGGHAWLHALEEQPHASHAPLAQIA